ncbi:hypothetical protein N9I58_00560 [Candidatus Thioglobus sp.]|nr:hypothetical protein [Candidatus Thioglobus sp.]
MKKLLLLLFSLTLSFNSYGETLICPGEVEMGGEMREITEVFKRSGDKFISYSDETLEYEMSTYDIAYDGFSILVLQKTAGFSQLVVSVDKFTKEFTSISLQTPTVLYITTGKCEFYEEYKLLN